MRFRGYVFLIVYFDSCTASRNFTSLNLQSILSEMSYAHCDVSVIVILRVDDKRT